MVRGQGLGLYESLDRLVGAGILALAPAVGLQVPPAAVRAGAAFAALLRQRGEAEAVGLVLDALARELWLAQEGRGLTLPAAEAHASGLVEVLAGSPPNARAVGRLLAGGVPTTAARDLAEEIVARAMADDALGAGLVPDHAAFLIERMLALLLGEPQLLPALEPAVREFLAHIADELGSQHGGGEAVGSSNAPVASTHDVGRVGAAVATTGVGQLVARAGVAPAEVPAQTERLAVALAAARRHLLAATPADADVRRLNAEAAQALAVADLDGAAALLQQARAVAQAARRRAEGRIRAEIADHQRCQTEQADATARLAELAAARLDFATAAHLFAEAAADLPATEAARRLALQLREVETLRLEAEQTGAEVHLQRAAALCAEIMRRAMSLGDRRTGALADLGLGQVLLCRAERRDATEPLEAAASAFRRALAALDRAADSEAAADALTGLGNALALTAERDPDATAHLADAAAAYADALPLIDAAATPIRYGVTHLKRGAALIRLGERADAPGHWIAAAGAMLSALDALEPAGADAEAALARASLRRLHDRLPHLLASA